MENSYFGGRLPSFTVMILVVIILLLLVTLVATESDTSGTDDVSDQTESKISV